MKNYFTNNEVAIIQYISNNLAQFLESARKNVKQHSADNLMLFDPAPIYSNVQLKFYPKDKSLDRIADDILTHDFDTELMHYLDTSNNYKAIMDTVAYASMTNSLEGIHRVFLVNAVINGIAQSLTSDPYAKRIVQLLKQANIKIRNRLSNEMVLYKLNFDKQKNHWQFNNTFSLLSEFIQNQERNARALALMNYLIENESVEHTEWLISFQQFFSDFMTAYSIDPSEETKIYFAYQATYGTNVNDQFVDVPFVKNRVYGEIFDIAQMIAVDPMSDDSDVEKLLSRAISIVSERKKLNQKYKN